MRHVNPSTGVDRLTRRALNLWWIALAAAEETAQGQGMAGGLMALFDAHLSTTDGFWLRWRDDLATSSEMRRAYSALYGRFFARALLQRTLAFRDFIPLETKLTRTAAVEVERIEKGDIPDWIAWDPIAGAYVLCEAKGNLTGSITTFRTGTPACAIEGKSQFDRVEVRDLAGTVLAANGWVGASLWATDTRKRQPVFLAWDPEGSGQRIPPRERDRHAQALHRAWLASLARGLDAPELEAAEGRPRVAVQISVRPTPDLIAKPPGRVRGAKTVVAEDDFDAPSRSSHTGLYVPALLTRFGLRGFRGPRAAADLLKAQQAARERDEPVWFVGLNQRATRATFNPLKPWSSAHGVVSREGLAVFDLRAVNIGRQVGA